MWEIWGDYKYFRLVALKVRQSYRYAIIISEINSFKWIHITVQHLNIQTVVAFRI